MIRILPPGQPQAQRWPGTVGRRSQQVPYISTPSSVQVSPSGMSTNSATKQDGPSRGRQFVERRWQQPPLIPVHVSKGEILVSLFNFPKVYAPAFLPVFETGPADAAALPSTRRRSTVPARLFQYACSALGAHSKWYRGEGLAHPSRRRVRCLPRTWSPYAHFVLKGEVNHADYDVLVGTWPPVVAQHGHPAQALRSPGQTHSKDPGSCR